MPRVRTRTKGPHKGQKYPLAMPEKKMPESTIVWSGSEYADNGYGFYFDYDVEYPEADSKQIKLDGMTREEARTKREEIVKLLGQDVVDAFYRAGGDSFDEEEEGDQAKVESAPFGLLNDLQYFDMLEGLFDYWNDISLSDIKEIGRFKPYDSVTGEEVKQRSGFASGPIVKWPKGPIA